MARAFPPRPVRAAPSRIDTERGEILRLIGELHQQVRSRSPASAGAPLARHSPRPALAVPSGTRGAARRRSSSQPRAMYPSTRPADLAGGPRRGEQPTTGRSSGRVADDAIMIALARVEARLTRVEERLNQVPGHRSARPPAGAQSHCLMGGTLRQDLLSDILQLLSSNSVTGRFVVRRDGVEYVVWLENGAIFHTVAPGLQGDAAFFAVFGLEAGQYFFEETTELPAERTITASTQFLILEALRQIDESQSDEE